MLKAIDNSALSIRPESKDDHTGVSELLQLAYVHSPYRHHNEHQFVETLRFEKALDVALVAHLDGDVVGYIALSKITVDRRDIGWYAIAPIAVNPKLQAKGIGARLINAALDRLALKNANGVVVLGEQSFYGKFGFTTEHGLRLVGQHPDYVLALDFNESAPMGDIAFHFAFDQEYDIAL